MSNSYFLASTEIFGLSKSTVKVYSFLRKVNNTRTNSSFYKKKNIAASCRVSESTVVRAIRELCRKGLLEVRRCFAENGRQTTNRYILLDNPQMKICPVGPQSVKKAETAKVCQAGKASPAAFQAKGYLFPCDSSLLHCNLTPTELKIYCYLVFRAGKSSTCLPSQKEIAMDCGVSLSTVFRVIRRLRLSGLLKIHPQTRGTTQGNNGRSVSLYVLRKNICIKEARRSLPFIFFYLLAKLTSSPTSPVTPQRTKFRNKDTLKQRKEKVLTKAVKKIKAHIFSKHAGNGLKTAKHRAGDVEPANSTCRPP